LFEDDSVHYHVQFTTLERNAGEALAFITGEGDGNYELKVQLQNQKTMMTIKFMD